MRQDKEERITSLALRYRAGERGVLGELCTELAPFVQAFLRRHLSAPHSLPVAVGAEDLQQQAYIAVAEAALQWRPERRDSFVPYFLSSFPWRIDRYLRSQTPSRRTGRLQLCSLPHDILMRQAADVAGADGRDWDDLVVCEELVRGLPRLQSQVVRLHIYFGLSFREVAEVLGITRSSAHEAFGRALSMLRSVLAGQASPGMKSIEADSSRRPDVETTALRRCVEAMHRLASDGVPLPGRETLCRIAGLTWREYRQIMARLRGSGCVVGRRRGSAGTLACASIAETMRKLESAGQEPRDTRG